MSFRERDLVKKLLDHYHKGLRPIITNSSHPTLVNISLKLVQIFEMDVKKQVVITSVWLKQAWFDPALQWDKSKHGWIDEISLSPDDVWVPDTVLLNNAETSKMGSPVGMKNPLLVTSHGIVRWLAPIILKSSCKLSVRYFPFDEQFCRLKFASWTYSKSTLLLQPEETEILQNYTESGEWYLEHVYALTSSSKATHSNTEDKSAVTYVIHIRRKVFYYFVYLITPCMVTSLMTIILFTLPPESGERMVVGVTILLSLTVFYLLASTHIPETSEVVPLIGRYYSLTIIEIACALGLTCWVLRFHHYNTSVGKVPKWVRVYILGYIAKVVRYRVPDTRSAENSREEEEGPCRELAFPAFLFFADKRLVNHTIRNVKVRDMDACEFLCYKEHSCVSISFENKVNTEGTFNCELNNSTHGEHNEDLVEAKHYFYHGTENACGKSPCKNGGTCQSGFTKKKYHCLCPPGFMGRICSNDIDECDENSHKCDENAQCKNTRGSYRCNCKSGYSGHGYKCTDIDECSAAGINKCDANAECTNTKGSYSCKCRAGYVGDGRTCTEKCHGIIPKHRADCGQPGISRDKCEQDNGCCYDDSAGESFPYCFYGRDRQVVMDSVIISNNGLYLRHLEHFLAPLVGENSKWELCYRSSTDRNVDHVFHSKCDGKNNTVTIIKKNEFVFGGFTDIPWEGIKGQGAHGNTSKAFLFSLRNKEELGPFKSMVREPSKAIFNQKYVGPTFGRDDIRIDRHRSDAKSSSGYTHFGRSYSVPESVNNSKTVLAGTHDFEADEVEVFYLD